MPLTLDELEACVAATRGAADLEEALLHLGVVVDMLASRNEMVASSLLGTSEDARHDYLGIFHAFERLLERDTSCWRTAGDELRRAALGVVPEPSAPQRQPSAEQIAAWHLGAGLEPMLPRSASQAGQHWQVDAQSTTATSSRSSSSSSSSGPTGYLRAGSEFRRKTAGAAFSRQSDAMEISTTHSSDGCVSADEEMCSGSSDRAAAGSECMLADAGEAMQDTAPCTWITVLLAALLPLLWDALPRDANGVCIVPHPHQMDKQEAREVAWYPGCGGRTIYHTNKLCDNCGAHIVDRFFYHCSINCDIDFCQECHRKSQDLLAASLKKTADLDRESMHRRLFWVIDIIERIGAFVLLMSAAERSRLADELAFEWPTLMFERLIQATVDVVNAKVVHVQDVKDVESDERFWYAMGWLQFLYSANALPCSTRLLDEESTRGPKVDYEHFILEGVNKCNPQSEFHRWLKHPSAKVPDVLAVENFELTADFCSFLTHSNLVPVGFRRVCLLCDVWDRIQQQQQVGPVGVVTPLLVEVPRDARGLLERVQARFRGLTDSELQRPLRVVFIGEEAVGPGVTKEFFQVALRSFLDTGEGEERIKLFECNERTRTYWFAEGADGGEAFRACGILLGQAVLNNVLVPNIFPRVLYKRLLQDLDSPCIKPLCVQDVATVSEDIARSLQHVLDCQDEDIAAKFGDLGWELTGRLGENFQLTLANKAQAVQAYIEWFFHERIAAQFEPLSAGFRAILGGSSLLRSMVDAVQLEKMVCGGTVPVDVAAIRRGVAQEGWTVEEEAEYLPTFWDILESFTEAEKVQFVVFVTASDRVPLKGWQDLGLVVQKNGTGDERLPAAYTCFSQLMLPKYTSAERLRTCLLLAVANSEGFGLR